MPVDAAAEEHFGPYLVYERLGVGGMATVHRALEQGAEGFERTVALKRLLPHLAEDASFIKSFVREAKLASILNHVNIVQIYELGRVGTEYFISMEYIDGRDLRRILRHARKVTGPPPINITIGLMLQLCDALDYAHNKVDEQGHALGLVHRDISPSNLIITSGGHLKVIDFGIAKAQSTQLRTHTGRVKGKLAYMAPEAVSGSRDLDARSDIWAAGVIIHELLTARPLFASKNEYQTLLKVQRGDILPPSTFNQACPPELDALVFRALERDPDQRFPSASEIREELLDLKRKYALPTGYRDIASWLDWAFALEPPEGFTGNTDSLVRSMDTARLAIRPKTPVPPNKDDDEACEVVWGAGAAESEVGPVVLEEVPDVSEKHRAKRDTENDSMTDDMPTPLPSYGTMPSIYGTDPNVVVQRGLPAGAMDPAFAGGTDPRFGQGGDPLRAQRGTTGQQQLAHATAQPAITGPQPRPQVPLPTGPVRNSTGPVAAMRRPGTTTGPIPKLPLVPRPAPLSQPPLQPRGPRSATGPIAPPESQRDKRTTAQGVMAKTGPVKLDAPQLGDRMAAQRARDEQPPSGARLSDEAQFDAESDALPTIADGAAFVSSQHPDEPTPRPRVMTDAPVSREASKDPGRAPGAQLAIEERPTQPSLQAANPLPVVRFAKPSIPPALDGKASGPVEKDNLPATTKPGMPPVRAATAPRRHRTTEPPTIGAAIAARSTKPNRTWLYLVCGAMIVAGVIAVTLLIGRADKPKAKADQIRQGSAMPSAPHVISTIKFVTEPEDAEIRIEGRAPHIGSPWSDELAPGTHQIEIHRGGYKAWLTSIELSPNETQTLRVVLEPISKSTDATLLVTTTPAGLEVMVDGRLISQHTPAKTTIKVGTHKLAVRQNGVEIWQQVVNAEPSTVYEFNPILTAPPTPELPKGGRPSTAPPPPPPPGRAIPTAPAPGAAPLTKPSETPVLPADKQDPSPPWMKPPGSPAPPPGPQPPPQPVAAVVAPTPLAPATTLTPTAPPPQRAQPAQPLAAPKPAQTPPKGPLIVPPSAVTKLAGEPPSIGKFKNVEVPGTLAAKVCTDETGKVVSVDLVTKVDWRVAVDLVAALRSWRYAPYQINGTRYSVCFVVPFRLK